MCGIAGYVGTFRPELLERMSALIAHRGPDDAGTWTDTAAGVGLAHRRLSIIDLRPEAHQPMANEDDTLWVTFNGEIYNFPELRAELVAKGRRFKSRSDTEILLHLYEEEGADMLVRLNGMFAWLWPLYCGLSAPRVTRTRNQSPDIRTEASSKSADPIARRDFA